MISKNRIEAIKKQAESEGVIGDIKSVLEQTLTVGALIKVLQKYNPDAPVEVEIPVEFDEETGDMFSQVGFVIDSFLSEGETAEAEVVTLRACKPDLMSLYTTWVSETE